MLSVLIDTNVLMVAVSPRSDLHWLYRALINREFNLIISTEIVLEYEEQLKYRYGETVVADFLLILAEANNVIVQEPHFRWNLIHADPDDNKFVDTYISSAADYLITHDKHFSVLNQLDFPSVNLIDAYSFQKIVFPI
jgi:uncharacterized protein